MKRFRNRPLCLALLLALGLFSVAPGVQSVFIINIDGLRCNEAFESGRSYAPFLWDSLRPLGTTYTSFYNTGITVTGSGHPTILTGVRQLLVNNDGIGSQIRPREPTLIECFRRSTGAPVGQTAFIDGKAQTCRYPVSIWPGYGYDFGPQLVYTLNQYDLEVMDSARAVIARSHPRLGYVLFAEVDPAGHSRDTARYLAAIRQADSLTFELWKLLQADPEYRDSTTFIVTSDHGRHDDRHGGWFDHGCACHGCRHVTFLALGPNIKADTTITDRADQTDIAPTVASILDFDMPYAQGRVLTEMFRNPQVARGRSGSTTSGRFGQNISLSPGLSRGADIKATNAMLHCVFSDDSAGERRILYVRSANRGNSWSAPEPVLAASGVEYTDPALAVIDSTTLLLVATAFRWVPEETTGVWVLRRTRSTDGGFTWQPESELDSLGMVTCRPAVCARGDRVELMYLQTDLLCVRRSRDRGVTFGARETVSVLTKHYPQYPAVTLFDTTPAAAWHALVPSFTPDSSQYRNVWFSHRPWSVHRRLVTHNGVNNHSREPSIECGRDSSLNLVYAHLPNASGGNAWSVAYQRGYSLGRCWSWVDTISGAQVAFQPAICRSDTLRLFCVWSTSDNGEWYLSAARSEDNGLTWSDPQPLTMPTDFTSQPRLAAAGDTCFVVWEERTADNREVFFDRFIITPTGAAESPAPPPLVPFHFPQPLPRLRCPALLSSTANCNLQTGHSVRRLRPRGYEDANRQSPFAFRSGPPSPARWHLLLPARSERAVGLRPSRTHPLVEACPRRPPNPTLKPRKHEGHETNGRRT